MARLQLEEYACRGRADDPQAGAEQRMGAVEDIMARWTTPLAALAILRRGF